MLEPAAESTSQSWCLCFRPTIHPRDDGGGRMGDFPGASFPFQMEKLKVGVQDPATEFAQFLSSGFNLTSSLGLAPFLSILTKSQTSFS